MVAYVVAVVGGSVDYASCPPGSGRAPGVVAVLVRGAIALAGDSTGSYTHSHPRCRNHPGRRQLQ